ncbi:MAG: hypothetical protein K2X81_12225, partial [Candidatus Obscuribacterales bacterium]|nr:hypothetical protein [Candidatus Obscuribacterales bacterium]
IKSIRYVVKAVHLAVGCGVLLALLHFYLSGQSFVVPGSIEREQERNRKLVAEGRYCCYPGTHIPGEYVEGDDILRNVDAVALASAYWCLLLWANFLRRKLSDLC